MSKLKALTPEEQASVDHAELNALKQKLKNLDNMVAAYHLNTGIHTAESRDMMNGVVYAHSALTGKDPAYFELDVPPLGFTPLDFEEDVADENTPSSRKAPEPASTKETWFVCWSIGGTTASATLRLKKPLSFKTYKVFKAEVQRVSDELLFKGDILITSLTRLSEEK